MLIQYLVQFGETSVPRDPVHAVTDSAVHVVGYHANVRTVTLYVAQANARDYVVLAGGDIADIATLSAVGGAAVNADC